MITALMIGVASTLAFSFYVWRLWVAFRRQQRPIPDSEFRIPKGGIIALLLVSLAIPAKVHTAAGQNCAFKIPNTENAAVPADKELLAQAPILVNAQPVPWWQRRKFKLAAITALHLAGAFDSYETNQLFDHLPPNPRFTATEYNPLLKPFAGHGTMYPAVQVGDGILSTWLLRARSSRNRKAAWAAVGVQIGLHIGLGLNNWRIHEGQWRNFRNLLNSAPPPKPGPLGAI